MWLIYLKFYSLTNIVAIVILTIFIVVIYLGFKSSYPPPDQCSLQQVWYKVTLTKNNSGLVLVIVSVCTQYGKLHLKRSTNWKISNPMYCVLVTPFIGYQWIFCNHYYMEFLRSNEHVWMNVQNHEVELKTVFLL